MGPRRANIDAGASAWVHFRMASYEEQVAQARAAAETLASGRRFADDVSARREAKAREIHKRSRAGRAPNYEDLTVEERHRLLDRADREHEDEFRKRLRRLVRK